MSVVRDRAAFVLAIAAMTVLAGCEQKSAGPPQAALGMSGAEVEEALGAPQTKEPGEGGDSVWRYVSDERAVEITLRDDRVTRIFQCAVGGDETDIQGTWKVVSAVEGGREEDRDFGLTGFVIGGGKIVPMLEGGRPEDTAEYRLDPNASPKTIDIIVSHRPEKESLPGIYTLAGDDLKICFRKWSPGEPRPTVFESPVGSNVTLLVLKRESRQWLPPTAEPQGRKMPMKAEKTPRKTGKTAVKPPDKTAARPETSRPDRTGSALNLRQIGLAMNVYHAAHNRFPPAYTTDKDDKPLLSWRVLILPYIDQADLYRQFHLDEPWDSPHNHKLVKRMPGVYECPVGAIPSGRNEMRLVLEGETCYQTLRGEKTAFPGKEGVNLEQINMADGASYTIAAVEARNPVVWTKPDDYRYDEKNPAAGLLFAPGGICHVVFCDAHTAEIPASTSAKRLNALFTRNGGEPLWGETPEKDEPTPEPADQPRELDESELPELMPAENDGFSVPQVRKVTKFSATQATERAVAAALKWLARHQSPDGAWNLKEYSSRCSDKTCTGPGKEECKIAATSLALLPFLAAGQTHQMKGPHQEPLSKAMRWLLQQQKADGDFRRASGEMPNGNDATMYTHGLATIALCQAYSMTGDKQVGEAAQKAVQFLESAQDQTTGGWRCNPNDRDDTSASGLQITALRSAQLAKLKVKPETLQRAAKWLQAVSNHDRLGEFSYSPDAKPDPCMTAVGLLSSLYLGAKSTDPHIEAGTQYLMKQLPDVQRRNVYCWYYSTAAVQKYGGPAWGDWNRVLRRLLVESQVQEGCAAGSWDPDKPTKDAWGDLGGRIFVTSLSTLSLEVYYCFLPLYKLSE